MNLTERIAQELTRAYMRGAGNNTKVYDVTTQSEKLVSEFKSYVKGIKNPYYHELDMRTVGFESFRNKVLEGLSK